MLIFMSLWTPGYILNLACGVTRQILGSGEKSLMVNMTEKDPQSVLKLWMAAFSTTGPEIIDHATYRLTSRLNFISAKPITQNSD